MSEEGSAAGAAIGIREAGATDLDSLVALQLQLGAHHRELGPDNPRYRVGEEEWRGSIGRALNDETCRFLIAADGDSVYGFVKLTFVAKPWGMSCEMDTLVVDESSRGSGIGELLVAAAEAEARQSGAKAVRANVFASNLGGQSFYRRMGYEEIAVRFGKSL